MSEQNNTNQQPQEEPKFAIKVDKPEDFSKEITEGSFFTTSKVLGQKISDIFSSVYADYMGCWIISKDACHDGHFNPIRTNPVTGLPELDQNTAVELYFHHYRKPDADENMPCAVSPNPKAKGTNYRASALVAGSEAIDMRARSGPKWFLTKEGQEGIAPFLFNDEFIFKTNQNSMFKRKDSERWNIITRDLQLGNEYVTIVSFLNTNKLIQTIYGKKDKDDKSITYTYGAKIVNVNPTDGLFFDQIRFGQTAQQLVKPVFSMLIQRINDKSIEKAVRDIGMCPSFNLC